MRTSYAVASSYSDRGVASSLVGRHRITFQTEFVRGHRLAFKYVQNKNRTVIWSDGAHTYSHWPAAALIGQPELIDDGADVSTAFAAAAGVSSGTSATVPALLLPVSIGAVSNWLVDLEELSIDRYEHIGSHPCVLVNGRGPRSGLTTLWIDRDTYLLRYLVAARGHMHETTTSFEPSIAPIDLSAIDCPDFQKITPKPRATPWTGIDIVSGAKSVEAIRDGSPAMRSGLAIGDEVEAVNGQRTDGFFDVIKAIHAAKIGEHLALTVRRGDSTREILVQVEAVPRAKQPVPSQPLVE
jgi:hypothetical protein